jgi:putative hydrolase of the HAD superfamily
MPMDSHASGNGIRGIVVDAVGTLIKPVPSVAEAYTAAARRQSVVLALEEVRARFQRHFEGGDVHAAHGAFSTDEATERRRWRKIVGGVLPEVSDAERAFEELWDHFSHPESWRVYPDAAPALRGLTQRGIAICIGSNFDRRLRPVVAGLPELEPWANSLVISSEVGYRKPHPQFFQAACSHLGLPPARVLCVGDDLENDVHGAIRAGLSGVLIDRKGNRGALLTYVPDLTALIELKFVQT